MLRPADPFFAILSQSPGESAAWAVSHASHASVDSKDATGSESAGMRAVNHADRRRCAQGEPGEGGRGRRARERSPRNWVDVQKPQLAEFLSDYPKVSCIFASVRPAA